MNNTTLNNIILKDLLEYMGEKVIPHGRKRYKLQKHDSLILTDSFYVWNSKGIRGNYYSLLNNLYGLKNEEILKIIKQFIKDVENKNFIPNKTILSVNNRKPKTYIKKENISKIVDYLSKKRGIDERIIKGLYKNKYIYSDDKNNVIFVIKDTNNKIVGNDIVGTSKVKFKCNTSSHYGFNIINSKDNIKNLYIFESSIDLLSYIELKPKNELQPHSRFLSISGVGREDILKNYLNNVEKLIICTDNDDAGNKFYEQIKVKYNNLKIYRDKPINKDFNDDLKVSKGLSIKEEKNMNSETNLNEKVLNFIENGNTINMYVYKYSGNYEKIKENFKNFKFSDGRSTSEYNPFKDEESHSDMIKITFYKSIDGSYNVIYNETSSLLHNDNVNQVLDELNSKLIHAWNKKDNKEIER